MKIFLNSQYLFFLYYYELNTHKEKIYQLEKYLNNHNFESDNYDTFENISSFISLRVYDENS